MTELTHSAASRRRPHPMHAGLVIGCALIGLWVGAGVRADTPQGRRPGEPFVEPRTLSAAERATIDDNVATIARGLGIRGQAQAPRRVYHALDLVSVDETEIRDGAGRSLAIIRTDAATGALRSVVRLDWSADADQPRVQRSAAADRARQQARLGGLIAPREAPQVRWDDAMDAWRVEWVRRVGGHRAPGDGLTVWIHRGGQLAALRQAESAVAPAPAEPIGTDAAIGAVRAWARRMDVPEAGLVVAVAAEPVWVHPNDFLTRGGADDTDERLHLAYRVDLTIPLAGQTSHHVAIFVDAGSGALIAGIETA